MVPADRIGINRVNLAWLSHADQESACCGRWRRAASPMSVFRCRGRWTRASKRSKWRTGWAADPSRDPARQQGLLSAGGCALAPVSAASGMSTGFRISISIFTARSCATHFAALMAWAFARRRRARKRDQLQRLQWRPRRLRKTRATDTAQRFGRRRSGGLRARARHICRRPSGSPARKCGDGAQPRRASISAGLSDLAQTRPTVAAWNGSIRDEVVSLLRERGIDSLVDAYGIHVYPGRKSDAALPTG